MLQNCKCQLEPEKNKLRSLLWYNLMRLIDGYVYTHAIVELFCNCREIRGQKTLR